jgi:hypothetical protein
MQPQRFSVKCFAQAEITFDLSALVPVFQRWIQQHSVEGLLIDVVDYKHVYQGPGVVLIGHEADYSFDLRGGRPGLLYTRKRRLQGSLADNLGVAFRLATEACQQLEKEAALNGIRFNTSEAEIMFLDRLNTPNTPETFNRLRDDLQTFAGSLYGTTDVTVESIETDPRKCFTVRIAAVREKVAG